MVDNPFLLTPFPQAVHRQTLVIPQYIKNIPLETMIQSDLRVLGSEMGFAKLG